LANFVVQGHVRELSSESNLDSPKSASLSPWRSGQREDHTASYFSHNNTEATRLRDQLAEDSLEMLIQWLKDGGNVGIHGMYH
jgi:hypothetical protein